MKTFVCLRLLRFSLSLVLGISVGAQAEDVGPANGTLVIAGGGSQDRAIYQRFMHLAGGPDAAIVVIPTAGEADQYDGDWGGLQPFKALGATNLTVLHTRERAIAESDAFVLPLKKAHGAWFSGGRQWRLADAYLDTKVHEELWALLKRGGVIGGTSAGATIQGSYLARGHTSANTIMMGDHERGLAFMRDVAIDQHLLRRNRQFDLIEIVEAHPHVLGIGLDENTAIVVRGGKFEVIGQSYVAIYDHGRMLDSGGKFYLLAPGDRYDLKTRTAFRTPRRRGILERVITQPWSQK